MTTISARFTTRLRPFVALLALPLLVACGATAQVSVRNITDATAVPIQNIAAPTDASQMTDMAAPTIVASSGNAAVPTDDNYVLIWLLYGTPTQIGSNAAVASVQGTAVSLAVTSTIAPTPTTGIAATPTVTLPPTIVPAIAPTSAPASSGASAGSTGHAANGQALFIGLAGCSTCHDTSNGNAIVGPSLKGVASRAGSRKPGMSASDYLHESIKTPNAFVVPGFPSGVMPQTFSQTLTQQQIDDLVAYLLTLK